MECSNTPMFTRNKNKTTIRNILSLFKKHVMKTQSLFYFSLVFVTCCIITWKAGSSFCAVLAYISLIVIMVGVAKRILARLDA